MGGSQNQSWPRKDVRNLKMINILYDGKVIHKQVTEEESLVILVELAEKAYRGEIDEDKVDFNYVQEKTMAVKAKSSSDIQSRPKKSRQGDGKNTKYASTSSNKARKRYRGQG